MTLNIKNPEAHKLAQKLAHQTGETMTRAVTQAIRERLARVKQGQKRETAAEDLLSIGRRCAATLRGNAIDHADLLYDDRGLPK